MNELMIFNNPEFGTVRTLEENGVVLFSATDVARALGYSNPYDAIARHCKGVAKREGVSRTTNQYGTTTEQSAEMSFIPESDLYRLVFRSKLPTARNKAASFRSCWRKSTSTAINPGSCCPISGMWTMACSS